MSLTTNIKIDMKTMFDVALNQANEGPLTAKYITTTAGLFFASTWESHQKDDLREFLLDLRYLMSGFEEIIETVSKHSLRLDTSIVLSATSSVYDTFSDFKIDILDSAIDSESFIEDSTLLAMLDDESVRYGLGIDLHVLSVNNESLSQEVHTHVAA